MRDALATHLIPVSIDFPEKAANYFPEEINTLGRYPAPSSHRYSLAVRWEALGRSKFCALELP